MKIKAIVAIDRNWGIGKENELLVHLPTDLQRFKDLTTGNVVIMGRKTLDSLPNGKPLPNRINIVLTRDASNLRSSNEAVFVESIAEVMEVLHHVGRHPELMDMDAYIIGGGEIYKQFLPYCDEVLLTRILEEYDVDTYFLNIEYDYENWFGIPLSTQLSDNGVSFRYQTFVRRKIK